MKFIQCLFIFLLAHHCLSAQVCELKDTHTDPDIPTPLNSGFKTNTFDWRDVAYPIYKPDIGKGTYTNNGNGTYTAYPTNIYTPFQNHAEHLSAIASDNDPSQRDDDPKDGWELIKQDLGFIYGPNGNPPWSATPKVPFLVQNGVTINNDPVPYIILYNKYSAKLRVIGMYKKYSAFQHVSITVEFKNTSNGSSALLNAYNSPALQPLDEKSKITKVSALAAFDQDVFWFYADYPMSYDACTCHYPSVLHVSFEGVSTSDILLTGKGLSTAISVGDINPNDQMYGDLYTDEFLTSYYDQPSTPKDIDKLVANYKSAFDAAKDIAGKKTVDYADATAKGFHFIGNALQIGGDDTELGIAGKVLGVIGDGIDFFSALGGKAPDAVQPMVISSEFVAKGKTTTSDKFGETFIGNPGSQNADNLPEYNTSSNAAYPMYNNAMGLFAMLHTPTADRYNYFHDQVSGGPDEFYTQTEYKDQVHFNTSSVQYALNPIVDADRTVILASIQKTGTRVNYKIGPPIDTIISTPFLPLGCLGNYIDDFYYYYEDNYGTETHKGEPSLVKFYDYKLVLSIVYVFKPDEYGITHSSYQLLKYPLKLNASSNTLVSQSSAPTFQSFPTNLNLHNTALPAGTVIYSFGDITIDGYLFSTGSGGPVYIRAEGAITVNPAANIGANVILESGVLLCSDRLEPTRVDEQFCKSDGYQANQMSKATESPAPTTLAIATSSDEVHLYPNPASNQTTLEFTPSAAQPYAIEITDLASRVLQSLSGQAVQGSNRVILDTRELPAGAYMITVKCGTIATSKKLVIVK